MSDSSKTSLLIRIRMFLDAMLRMLWFGMLLTGCAGCVYFAYLLKISSEDETRDAFESARRLIIVLETHEILGKIIQSEAPVSTETDAAPVENQEATSDAQQPVSEVKKELTEEAKRAAEEHLASESVKQQEAVADEKAPDVMKDLSAEPLKPVTEAQMMAGALASLQEETEFGVTPKIGANGAKPWKYYSKPFTPESKKPMIAIVVKGLGKHSNLTENALRLPENISLSFSPYSKDIQQWAASARVTGHEVYVDLPLHPSDYPVTDPGPYGIMIGKGAAANEKNLQWVLSRLPVYVGVLTSQHEKFTTDIEAFKLVLQSINNRGLLFVMSRKPSKAEMTDVIELIRAPHVIVDTIVDEELSADIIQARLAQLEQRALKKGYAIGVINDYPLSIQQLREWSDRLATKDITLAPLSAVAKEINE